MPPRLTQAEFLGRARAIHGDRYDYSETEYDLASRPVRIICRAHGPFEQLASDHMYPPGHGCDRCADEENAARARRKDFTDQARLEHGDRYGYSLVDYVNRNEPVTIICPEHGQFRQIAKVHLNGGICQTCTQDAKSISTDEFIGLARQVHADRYDYSHTTYTRWRNHITIVCPLHGPFRQQPKEHITSRAGCMQCGSADRRLDTATFLERARHVHGERYDYSHTVYVNARTKVTIVCPDHGPFDKNPTEHLRGAGCPIEGRQQRWANPTAVVTRSAAKGRQASPNVGANGA